MAHILESTPSWLGFSRCGFLDRARGGQGGGLGEVGDLQAGAGAGPGGDGLGADDLPF